MLTTLLFVLEIKFVLKIESNSWGISRTLYYKTNRGALSVLCSCQFLSALGTKKC